MATGIKEIKEAITAIFAVIKLVYGIGKDGITPSDGWSLLNAFFDPTFRKTLNDGIQGVNLIKGEALDIDSAERTELWALINAQFSSLKLSGKFTAEDEEKVMEYVFHVFKSLKE